MRRFRYVGPAEIRDRFKDANGGTPLGSRADLLTWIETNRPDFAGEDGWVTYVVNLEGSILIAPRRSEHVACARGSDVLAAGEMRFDVTGTVVEVTNNSTGYCPAEDCWPAVRAALDSASLEAPGEFTFVARFRRCPKCGERNLVKDDWFECAMCEEELPSEWNFGNAQE